jgi:hypothetical protein
MRGEVEHASTEYALPEPNACGPPSPGPHSLGPTVYYALGEGLGHVTRTLAFARQMARRVAGPHVLLASTSFRDTASALVATEPAVQLRLLPDSLAVDDARRLIPRWLNEFAPQRLVVDTFPRGLVGDLAKWLASTAAPPLKQRLLLSRRLPAEYVRSHQLVDFVNAHYGQVLVAGEQSPFAHLDQAQLRPLFLLRDHGELPRFESSARLLDVPAEQGAVLVVASGRLNECQEWLGWADTLLAAWPSDLPPLRVAVPMEASCFATPQVARILVRHLPLLDCLPAARLILGAAGYNLTAETRTLGIPTLQFPAARLYDDQQSRVVGEPLDPRIDTVLGRIRQYLLAAPPRIPPYDNGAATDGLTFLP